MADELTCDTCGATCSVAYCREERAGAPQRCTRCHIEHLEAELGAVRRYAAERKDALADEFDEWSPDMLRASIAFERVTAAELRRDLFRAQAENEKLRTELGSASAYDAELGRAVREIVGEYDLDLLGASEDVHLADEGEPDKCRVVVVVSDEQASILSELADVLREKASDG